MAEIAVSYLLNKVGCFLENEVSLLRGVQEEIIGIREELESMRAFLQKADTLEDRDMEVKVWLKQLREFAYDTEDIIDEFSILLLHDHDHHRHSLDSHGDKLYGFLHKMSCCIKNLKARHRLAFELQGIKSRIRDIFEGYCRIRKTFHGTQDASILLKAGTGTGTTTWRFDHSHRGGDALVLDKYDLVGMDGPIKKVIYFLMDGGFDRQVISVVGMGGMGKTTLAKQVYDDPDVKKHFSLSAWITVSSSGKMRDFLQDIVQQLFSADSKSVPKGLNIMGMDNTQLKTTIKLLLQNRRYLIVLDDIWHINEWQAVKYALPTNNFGSRVLLTTRNIDLALTSAMESQGKVYNLEPLPPQDSWTLFCRKSFQGNSCPSHLEDICRSLLTKCEGLPLAIVALAGALTTKDKQRIDEWEMVRRSLGAEIEGNGKLKNLKTVLSLSFNDLPYYLKSCFLYLGIFPADHFINHNRLVRLWMAEGFVTEKFGVELEDVAEDYLNQLVDRSLLQVAQTRSDGRVKSYRIHDLMREIIISKSRDQNFAVIAKEHNQNSMWPDKIRRLSIHKSSVSSFPRDKWPSSQLRTLFIFDADAKHLLNALFPTGFRLLNVLDLEGASINRFPIQIINLYYLKYLSLKNTKVHKIPGCIGKLQNLETLDLKHSYVSELPVEILKLKQLRHLLVYRYEYQYLYGFKTEKIGDFRSLQELCFIDATQGNGDVMKAIGKLKKLRRLGITKLRKEDGKTLCSSIENLSSLRSLSLISIQADEILDLGKLYFPPQFLQRLYLSGRLEMLPLWMTNLPSLVRLHLKWSRLKYDPILYLQVLPNLVHVELLGAYQGDTLCFKSGGFKKLKILGIDKFDELRCIIVEEGAMPCLEKLRIQRCKLLEKVPLGIEYLTKLKVLDFVDMPQQLINKIQLSVENGGDHCKVAHIPEIYSTFWKNGGWEVYSLDTSVADSSRPSPVTRTLELSAHWK